MYTPGSRMLLEKRQDSYLGLFEYQNLFAILVSENGLAVNRLASLLTRQITSWWSINTTFITSTAVYDSWRQQILKSTWSTECSTNREQKMSWTRKTAAISDHWQSPALLRRQFKQFYSFDRIGFFWITLVTIHILQSQNRKVGKLLVTATGLFY